MNKLIQYAFVGVALLVAATFWDGFFVLPEGRQAVVTQFGAPVGQPVTEAGLHLKTPFLQDVAFFEKKIMIWDGNANQIPTNDKTFVYLDVTARWRISNALQFLQAVNNEKRAQTILDDVVDSTVRDLVNKNNLVEIIRSSDYEPGEYNRRALEEGGQIEEKIELGRDRIAKLIHESASKITPRYGIELVDVMFKRVNYIDTVRRKVYERMISERKRIAAEKRSLGEGQKAEILGKVERELKSVTSEAFKVAEEIKGNADGQAARIYADAYNQDPDFYSFYNTLKGYEKTLGKNSRLILSSDSELYKYIQSM